MISLHFSKFEKFSQKIFWVVEKILLDIIGGGTFYTKCNQYLGIKEAICYPRALITARIMANVEHTFEF